METENAPSQPAQNAPWWHALDHREQAQMLHARAYARDHAAAGAPGHGQFLLIAKLSQLLDDQTRGADNV